MSWKVILFYILILKIVQIVILDYLQKSIVDLETHGYIIDFQYSFFDGKYTSFSLNNLDDQISKTYHSGYSIRGKHRKFNLLQFKVLSLFDILTGITTPSIFFGTPGSYFGPHCQDFYLENINYHHYGSSKIWIIINPKNYEIFTKFLQ